MNILLQFDEGGPLTHQTSGDHDQYVLIGVVIGTNCAQVLCIRILYCNNNVIMYCILISFTFHALTSFRKAMMSTAEFPTTVSGSI